MELARDGASRRRLIVRARHACGLRRRLTVLLYDSLEGCLTVDRVAASFEFDLQDALSIR